jgi:predicted nucleic acid-binding protein
MLSSADDHCRRHNPAQLPLPDWRSRGTQKVVWSHSHPQAVFDEMHRPRTPQPVKDWIDSKPPWIEVRRASLELLDLGKSLGTGEREAIALGIELQADALLLDDKKARNEARKRQIPIITTLNVLEAAGERGWLDLSDAVTRLRGTNFYLPAEDVVEEMLKRNRQRIGQRQEPEIGEN